MGKKKDEIKRLRQDCADAYQIIGHLASEANLFETKEVEKALDNIYAAAAGKPRPHGDLIPFAPKAKQTAKKKKT